MQENNRDTNKKESVTSTYADIYLVDDYCNYEEPGKVKMKNVIGIDNTDWISPSDLLIGIVELKPPFTSKITRGKTHEGILGIGNDILEKNRAAFEKKLTKLINDNDSGWIDILETEKKLVDTKVRKLYDDIFVTKSKIMNKEISDFYEQSLQKLENNIRSQIEELLTSVHAGSVSDLNFQIEQKLSKERKVLEDTLKKRYSNEVHKIERYYKLLLGNELQRHEKIINNALHDRNNALNAFCKQMEAENLTSTMYVMCTERKKCKIKQFLLENYQTTDISEKVQKIKEKDIILEKLQDRDVKINLINEAWENKIKKVLQLFLKFISFSLKLLPEQTTFLLDLEKMVVLQMNEFQKKPQNLTSILVDKCDINNLFQFEEPKPKTEFCVSESFVIVGDLNNPTPPKYGSSETLASDVDLPYFRIQRQFVYAKCHKYEEIKAVLDSQICKCQEINTLSQFKDENLNVPLPCVLHSTPPECISSLSSNEPLLIDDIQRLHDCPARRCQDWAKKCSFPDLYAYLDFSDENYERVKTILGVLKPTEAPPKLIDPVQLVNEELLFSVTKERYHTVETQYSSQEDLNKVEVSCTCVTGRRQKATASGHKIKETSSVDLREILQRRKQSLRNLLQKNPNLLKIFTDECFDFVL
ncbi:unnamed protein product [Chilo suppressalis]|uniref:Uncharacterized protein n=1 Tax=Chilo suppressalis TaxID=168631 RepID=A0ABN8AWB8_CHISP|nr:unnamed protein product [Chilo suppressalis]